MSASSQTEEETNPSENLIQIDALSLQDLLLKLHEEPDEVVCSQLLVFSIRALLRCSISERQDLRESFNPVPLLEKLHQSTQLSLQVAALAFLHIFAEDLTASDASLASWEYKLMQKHSISFRNAVATVCQVVARGGDPSNELCFFLLKLLLRFSKHSVAFFAYFIQSENNMNVLCQYISLSALPPSESFRQWFEGANHITKLSRLIRMKTSILFCLTKNFCALDSFSRSLIQSSSLIPTVISMISSSYVSSFFSKLDNDSYDSQSMTCFSPKSTTSTGSNQVLLEVRFVESILSFVYAFSSLSFGIDYKIGGYHIPCNLLFVLLTSSLRTSYIVKVCCILMRSEIENKNDDFCEYEVNAAEIQSCFLFLAEAVQVIYNGGGGVDQEATENEQSSRSSFDAKKTTTRNNSSIASGGNGGGGGGGSASYVLTTIANALKEMLQVLWTLSQISFNKKEIICCAMCTMPNAFDVLSSFFTLERHILSYLSPEDSLLTTLCLCKLIDIAIGSSYFISKTNDIPHQQEMLFAREISLLKEMSEKIPNDPSASLVAVNAFTSLEVLCASATVSVSSSSSFDDVNNNNNIRVLLLASMDHHHRHPDHHHYRFSKDNSDDAVASKITDFEEELIASCASSLLFLQNVLSTSFLIKMISTAPLTRLILWLQAKNSSKGSAAFNLRVLLAATQRRINSVSSCVAMVSSVSHRIVKVGRIQYRTQRVTFASRNSAAHAIDIQEHKERMSIYFEEANVIQVFELISKEMHPRWLIWDEEQKLNPSLAFSYVSEAHRIACLPIRKREKDEFQLLQRWFIECSSRVVTEHLMREWRTWVRDGRTTSYILSVCFDEGNERVEICSLAESRAPFKSLLLDVENVHRSSITIQYLQKVKLWASILALLNLQVQYETQLADIIDLEGSQRRNFYSQFWGDWPMKLQVEEAQNRTDIMVQWKSVFYGWAAACLQQSRLLLAECSSRQNVEFTQQANEFGIIQRYWYCFLQCAERDFLEKEERIGHALILVLETEERERYDLAIQQQEWRLDMCYFLLHREEWWCRKELCSIQSNESHFLLLSKKELSARQTLYETLTFEVLCGRIDGLQNHEEFTRQCIIRDEHVMHNLVNSEIANVHMQYQEIRARTHLMIDEAIEFYEFHHPSLESAEYRELKLLQGVEVSQRRYIRDREVSLCIQLRGTFLSGAWILVRKTLLQEEQLAWLFTNRQNEQQLIALRNFQKFSAAVPRGGHLDFKCPACHNSLYMDSRQAAMQLIQKFANRMARNSPTFFDQQRVDFEEDDDPAKVSAQRRPNKAQLIPSGQIFESGGGRTTTNRLQYVMQHMPIGKETFSAMEALYNQTLDDEVNAFKRVTNQLMTAEDDFRASITHLQQQYGKLNFSANAAAPSTVHFREDFRYLQTLDATPLEEETMFLSFLQKKRSPTKNSKPVLPALVKGSRAAILTAKQLGEDLPRAAVLAGILGLKAEPRDHSRTISHAHFFAGHFVRTGARNPLDRFANPCRGLYGTGSLEGLVGFDSRFCANEMK